MRPETEPFTHQRKVQNIGNTISDGHTIGRATQELTKHIYEQHGLRKNLDPVVMNR